LCKKNWCELQRPAASSPKKESKKESRNKPYFFTLGSIETKQFTLIMRWFWEEGTETGRVTIKIRLKPAFYTDFFLMRTKYLCRYTVFKTVMDRSACDWLMSKYVKMYKLGFRVPNNTNLAVWVCALSLCAPQKPACSVFVAPQATTKIDEQRRELGDACVLAVPAKYARPSSGDHPQQYYYHQFCARVVQGPFNASHTWRLSRQSLFSESFFLATEKCLYPDSFISPQKTPLGTNALQQHSPRGSCVPALWTHFLGWGCVCCVPASQLPGQLGEIAK